MTATEAADAAATAPHIVTPYPGPRARAVIDRMRAVEGAGPRTAGPDDPLVVDEAHGSVLVDPDGNRFVDLGASFAATTIGHSHPAVVAAIRDQAGRAAHVSSASISEARIAFEEALLEIAPPGLDRVLLGLTGSDANDTALKLARTATGRREVIAFSGGYFGRGSGVIGLAGKATVRSRGRARHRRPLPALPLPVSLAAGRARDGGRRRPRARPPRAGGPGVRVRTGRGHRRRAGPGQRRRRHPARRIPRRAARPVRSPRHRPRLRRDPVRLRADRPDLGRRALGRRPGPDDGRQGHRRRDGGLGGRRARRVHEPLDAGRPHDDVHGQRGQPRRRPGGHRRPARRGASPTARRPSARTCSSGSRPALGDDPHVGEVRGLGLFIGIEIVADRETRAPDAKRAAAIRRWAFERGVLLGGGGHHENVVKVCPPLTIETDLLDAAVELTIDAIKGAR